MVTQFTLNRGDICWCEFGQSNGSEPAKRRPVVVVQVDALNRSRLNTTIVIPLTSQLKYSEFPNNVFISTLSSGLAKDSVALTHQISVVDENRLDFPLAQLPANLMAQIDNGLANVLGNCGS